MRRTGDTAATAAAVEKLVGITPNYVFLSGFDGFTDMVDTIGGVEVKSDEAFHDSRFDLTVKKGRNDFDGTEALDFSRSRVPLGAGDLARFANQQQVMRDILNRLLEREDEEGFMERGTLSALAGLPTWLPRSSTAGPGDRPDPARSYRHLRPQWDPPRDLGWSRRASSRLPGDAADQRDDVHEDLRFDQGC